jgi:glycosyltransferase involved in cell wall biosynthesis
MRRTATVIIRTKNEARCLGATLKAVLKQDLPPHEVIVIDSGSTDPTLAIAARYPVQILEIASDDWSYPRALNVAAARAGGEILVCLSAHCRPVDELWLGAMLGHFDAPDVAGVWGPDLRPGRPRVVPGPPSLQRPGSYTVENRTWGLSNANSAIRQDLWEEFPFDEKLPAAEDKAWAMEAMQRGYSIVHEPRAAVWHAPHTVRNAYERNRKVMEGFKMMFPELEDPVAGMLSRVAGAARDVLVYNLRNRDLRTLWQDVRRAPSIIAAVVGGYLGRNLDS